MDRIEEEIRFISIALQKLQKSDPEYKRLSKKLSASQKTSGFCNKINAKLK